MSEEKLDRMIQLLEDIKSQQKEHFDNYRTALGNQAESIKLQKDAMQTAKMVRRTIPVLLVLIIFVVWVIWKVMAYLH